MIIPESRVDSEHACLFLVSSVIHNTIIRCAVYSVEKGVKFVYFFSFSLLPVLAMLENIGFVANMSTMVLYFHLFFNLSSAANTLTNFLGSTFFLTILGGFISDTYLNRLHTCLIFGFLEIMVETDPLLSFHEFLRKPVLRGV